MLRQQVFAEALGADICRIQTNENDIVHVKQMAVRHRRQKCLTIFLRAAIVSLALLSDYWKWNRYRIGVVMLLLLWSISLITARVYYTKSITYLFLYWNLGLAIIPLIVSTLLIHTRLLGRLHVLLFIVWIIFFPNAPYVLTDLLHLKQKPPVPEWFDLGLLLSCAGASLFIGYLSLQDIHVWISERVGKRWGWSLVVGMLFLSSFGIYLGRFLRWNSWDVLLAPAKIMSDMVFVLSNHSELARAIGVTALFGMMLTLGYLALHAVSCQKAQTLQ